MSRRVRVHWLGAVPAAVVLAAGCGGPGSDSPQATATGSAVSAAPTCGKTPVTLVKDGTALKCGSCHRVYPIKDDIPVMLIDEATIEK